MPLPRLVGVVGTMLIRGWQRLLAAHGLARTSFGLLAMLAAQDGLAHREAACRLWVTPATLTPVVDALERSGDLRRERDPADRRVVRLRLTDGGRSRLESVSRLVSQDTAMPVPTPEEERVIRGYLLGVMRVLTEGGA